MEDALRPEAEPVPAWQGSHLLRTLEADETSARKVLVVDDEDEVRRVIADFLRLDGYTVCEASDAQTALAYLERERFAVVVTDLVMPRMDGVTFMTTALQHGHDAAYIVMTGFATWDTAVAAMKLGAADYLPKPFHLELLRLVVARTFEKRHLVARAKQADMYEKLAHTDGLTELYNYRFFQQLLGIELSRARRFQRPLALIMLDVDRFKSYNDLYGHQAGDRALRQLAGLLQRSSRSYDLVARYGGDEFAVILPETRKGTAMEVAERIRAAVAETLIDGDGLGAAQHITASFGIAAFPDDAVEESDLIRQADCALYHAKARGRDRLWCAGSLAPDRLGRPGE
jgi:two-component system cell cycle response regulator